MDWKNFLKLAYTQAEKSTNPSTQNGAVLVDDEGKVILSVPNCFPEGVAETDERQVREVRHKYSVHAERNAIFQAAKLGIKTEGLTLVCPWAACSDCAQGIIQAGIKRLVTHKSFLDLSGEWREGIELAFEMLREAGVEVVVFDGKIGGVKVLSHGKFFEP